MMFEEENSSDDNDESSFKQVLPMTNEKLDPIDIDKMPTTGEEYLRQVRYQASLLPDFRTVPEADKISLGRSSSGKHAWHGLFLSTTHVTTTTTTRFVSSDWQNEQCLAFSNARNDFYQMRDRMRATNKNYKAARLKGATNYWKFCFGDDIPFQSPLTSFDTDDQQQSILLPTMSKMITLTQSQIHELLKHEIKWLKECGCSLHLALYMYATLIAIEKPISEDVTFTMRQACLCWKETRTKLLIPPSDSGAEKIVDSALLKSCDLFVCIIGRYFGQFDLADVVD